MHINRGGSFMLPLQVFVDGQAQDCMLWRVFASYGSPPERLGNF